VADTSPVSTATRLTPAMADAIAACMRADQRVVVWGEDVSIGVMGPTRGLKAQFGERVRDTPISEQGFVGAAIGAAMGGLRPVIDLMFASFAYVCFDQLVNQAGRIRYMTGGGWSVPLTVIASSGAAGANAAQHSECLHAMLMAAGGIRVVVPSTVHQAYWLTRSAIEDPDPVAVLFHPALAGERGSVGSQPLRLGQAVIDPAGSDVTIVACGGLMAKRSRQAAATMASRGVACEVVDACSLVPLDRDAICASVAKTGRLVVVDEARRTCSAASEVAALVAEREHRSLRAAIRRVCVEDVPIPFSPALEAVVVPDEARIVAAVEGVLGA
jgi:acetoin:2,6-dichlorophenolindophenol oxidoreductase subunit beta